MVNTTADLLYPIFQDALEMLTLTHAAFIRHDPNSLDSAEVLGRSIHKRETELTEGLIRSLREMEVEATPFTEGGITEVRNLFDRAHGLLECARDLTRTGNQVLARHIELECMRFQEVASRYAQAHETRLIEGVCQPQASSAYLAILDSLREVARHSRQIAHRVAATRLAPPGPAPTR